MGRGGMADARRIDAAAVPRAAGRVLLPRHQSSGRVALPRRRGGAGAARAQQRRLGGELFAHADPALHPDGRGAVPHRARGEGDRRRRAPDPAASWAPCRGRGGGRHRVLRDFRLDHRHHGDARQPDAAGDARPRLRPDHGARAARGSPPPMATGPRRAIGAVGMLIPPSALTVLLGSLSGISISKLLIGGVVPGLLLSVAFVADIVTRVKLNPALAPTASFVEYRGWERLRPFLQYVVPLVSIFAVVVASMSAGWATPTESAAIGALFTMVLAMLYRSLTIRNLVMALRGTTAISGMILFIIVGATTFSQVLSFSGASSGLVELIAGTGMAPFAVIAAMMLLLIFLGLFVEQVSMMLITLPIYMPLVQKYGVDPVWFGVMFLICMQLGLLLPPHGLLLMTMKGVAPPTVRMGHIFQAVLPYIVMSLLLLALVFLVPAVAVWLPKVLV